MTDINEVLAEREKTYGEFPECADLAQNLKAIMIDSIYGSKLANYQALALEMIALKIARILNGDPNHIDSWRDISGFATLVVRELEK